MPQLNLSIIFPVAHADSKAITADLSGRGPNGAIIHGFSRLVMTVEQLHEFEAMVANLDQLDPNQGWQDFLQLLVDFRAGHVAQLREHAEKQAHETSRSLDAAREYNRQADE
jgi:hypothetical protein